MTVPQRRPARRPRGTLDSPWFATTLVLLLVLIAGMAWALPQLLDNQPGPSPTAAPSESPAIVTPSPGAPTFVRPTPSPAPTFISYVVRSGDSLTSIARKFDTTARSIAWWNRGAYPSLDPESEAYDPNRVEVGWTLVLIPGVVVDDTNPPTPSPGPTGTPEAPPTSDTVTPAPTNAAAPASVISHGTRTVPTIALTFDMGGRLDPAVDIVRWLIGHDVHATFFPTGYSGSQTILGVAAMELASERSDLFDVGNHSWDHPDFRTITAVQMATELATTESAMTPIIGSTKPWFRPPYGGYNDAVKAGVGAAGWRYLVMWDVDMIDWRPVSDGGPTAADMVAKLRANGRGGSIVLMHLGGYHTLEALPGLLDALEDMGLVPVTLGEMFGK